MSALDVRARSFSAFRILGDGSGRAYTRAEGSLRLMERTLRMAQKVGYVGESTYAVLDVLDDNDDVIQDFGIPSPQAFRWWYRKLGLRVQSDDGQRDPRESSDDR